MIPYQYLNCYYSLKHDNYLMATFLNVLVIHRPEAEERYVLSSLAPFFQVVFGIFR